ncbi:hypothetical protein QE152_g4309 [Popillia japonica]|uniref:Uncharacterized protein n=1 Tax=Popillia japonica TaxID=7064 RepID=A0AAW1MYX2_POPJA
MDESSVLTVQKKIPNVIAPKDIFSSIKEANISLAELLKNKSLNSLNVDPITFTSGQDEPLTSKNLPKNTPEAIISSPRLDIVPPQIMKKFPKASRECKQKNKRNGRKSEILTNTPIKAMLEARTTAKPLKRKPLTNSNDPKTNIRKS